MDPQDCPQAPLVVHLIYQLSVGGLENGLVNLINKMSRDHYRHTIICLKTGTDLKVRIKRNDIEIYSLNKVEGQDWGSFVRLFQLIRRLRPTIVHTRNLATIEYQLPALFAGVKFRVHGEHGWDIFDPDGKNKKYQFLRRLIKPIIQHFIPLSKQLEQYLVEKIHVPEQKITRICNGVDTTLFFPASGKKIDLAGCPFDSAVKQIYIGTVGRMHGVKDQITLVKAFIRVFEKLPDCKSQLRLIVVGEGPLKAKAEKLLSEKKLVQYAWLTGERTDIPDILRKLDIFILPSLAEGISNTLLEAMATGLPVIATAVGGNPELVQHGRTGRLIPKGDPEVMAEQIIEYLTNKQTMLEHGKNARQRALEEFSLDTMIDRYQSVYDDLVKKL